MTTLKLEDVDATETFTKQPQYVADTERFAVYTQLARLLAAEDIIVRWNVRGMDCPASMNYATRVLDVAPIKRERENMIPGLILHEVGHFLFSENVAIASTDGHAINVARANELRDKIKNHRVWNIIEDGFIERRVVAKWPGALKHFRVLYDFDLEMSGRDAAEGTVPMSIFGLVPTIINSLHLNVLGAKWNERFDYPAGTPGKLRTLLEKARLCMGNADERADLSTAIVNGLIALSRPAKPAPKPIRKAVAPVQAPEMSSPIERAIDDVVEEIVEAAEAAPKVELSHAEKDEIDVAMRTIKEQTFVEDTLGADLTIDKKKDEQAAAPKKTTEKASEKAEAPIGGPGGPGGRSPTDDDEEEENAEPTDEAEVEETGDPTADSLDDYAFFEEFISNSKARMLGANKNYLEHVMSDADAPADDATVRHVPSMAQVLATVNTEDLISDNLKKVLPNVSFRRFLDTMSKAYYKETNKLPNSFNKKVNTARATAQQMYQRFTTKANAMNVALTRYRTTGSLDPTRAALYKIYDDVFQKKRQAPQQINHGYVVMVDWSSSMDQSTMELFHRILELSLFAQLANVEIDIWLYTTSDKRRREKLQEAGSKLQPNVMLLGSKFVHVLNTKQHVGDELNYRLYAMFLNAAQVRNGRLYKSIVTHGSEKLLGVNFADEVWHSQCGTNIFEALNFAIARAQKLQTQRRAILLLTDGDDNHFGTVTDGNGGELKEARVASDLICNTAKLSQVMYNGANLIDIAKAAKEAAASVGYRSTPLDNVRTLASLMLADSAREEGISIVGVTWGSFISAHMEAWSRKNVVRIEVPYKDLYSKNINVYSMVENTFITHITEALLSNIKK